MATLDPPPHSNLGPHAQLPLAAGPQREGPAQGVVPAETVVLCEIRAYGRCLPPVHGQARHLTDGRSMKRADPGGSGRSADAGVAWCGDRRPGPCGHLQGPSWPRPRASQGGSCGGDGGSPGGEAGAVVQGAGGRHRPSPPPVSSGAEPRDSSKDSMASIMNEIGPSGPSVVGRSSEGQEPIRSSYHCMSEHLRTPLVPRDVPALPGRSCRPLSSREPMAGVEGLEPPTPGFGDRCSSQLSYTPAGSPAGSARGSCIASYGQGVWPSGFGVNGRAARVVPAPADRETVNGKPLAADRRVRPLALPVTHHACQNVIPGYLLTPLLMTYRFS